MPKTILLFSGGFDSLLAFNILKNQGVDVVPICFESYFFGSDLARKTADENGFEIKTVNIAEEQLAIVKDPAHGRGRHFNPCVDCHFLMLKKAKEAMVSEGADFVSTGEVLGQRPFSQNLNVFQMMERGAGLEGLILRPLSARLLPETIPEKKGMAKREYLSDIQGRSRKPQFELAKKFNIKFFPQPAGGCLLTDPNFSERLGRLMSNSPDFGGDDVEILKKGRPFFEDNFLIVVARDQRESEGLAGLKKEGDILLEPENFAGPTALVRFFCIPSRQDVCRARQKAERTILEYSKKAPAHPEIKIISTGRPC